MEKIVVEVTKGGDVKINGNYYRQCCFDNEAVGVAVTAYLDGEPADNVDDPVDDNQLSLFE